MAVVGARRCSSYGEKMTLRFVERLAESGIQIISGMALGIDGMAHRAALNVGGKTFAVLEAERMYVIRRHIKDSIMI